MVRFFACSSAALVLSLSAEATGQEASVPTTIIRSNESRPDHAAVTYAARCGRDEISVRVEVDDPIAPRVTVAIGEASRTYDLTEPFVQDLFLGNRYELIRLRCVGDGLGLLVLLGYSRGDDQPVFAVGSVNFDRDLNVSRYDGIEEESASGALRFVNRDFYERAARCEAEFETQAEVEACTYPDRRRSGD